MIILKKLCYTKISTNVTIKNKIPTNPYGKIPYTKIPIVGIFVVGILGSSHKDNYTKCLENFIHNIGIGLIFVLANQGTMKNIF